MTSPPTPAWHGGRFIGRGGELSALSALGGRSRVVTLLGPPGVGKSRLAMEHARAAVQGGAVRLVLCELRAAEGADALCLALASALDLPQSPGPDADAWLRDCAAVLARQGQILFVFDNAETAADALAGALPVLLAAAPEARFVVSSRRRIGIADEAILDVAPLPVPESAEEAEGGGALALFLDRARAVRHDYTYSSSDAPLVLELLTQLDGLPLAIELAAARLRIWSLRQLVENLPRRFQWLSRGPARSSDPPRILLEEMERSWALLGRDEQAAFAQCSVFRGGFDAAAAEAVLDLGAGAPWALDVLQSLRDQSLVATCPSRPGAAAEEPDHPRFTLLSSLSAFAAQKLADLGGREAAFAAHARHYVELGRRACEGANGGDPAMVAGLHRDMENLLAVHARAVERCAQGGSFWPEQALLSAWIIATAMVQRGPLAVGLDAIDRALAATAGADVALGVRVRAAEASSAVEVFVGRVGRSAERCKALFDEAAAAGDDSGASRMARALGDIETSSGRFTEGAVWYERAIAALGEGADALTAGRLRAGLACNRLEAGRLAEARLHFAQALPRLRASRDRTLARALNWMGVIEIEEGRVRAARACFGEALEIATLLGDRRLSLLCRVNLAAVSQEEGLLAEAEAELSGLLTEGREGTSPRSEGHILAFLGNCLFEQGRLPDAQAAYEEAARRLEGGGWRLAMVLGPLGAVKAARGDLAGAEADLARAEASLGAIGQERLLAALRVHEGHVEVERARLARQSGDLAAAREQLDRARARLRDAGCDPRPMESLGGPTLAVQSTDVRIALRCLRLQLDAAEAPAGSPALVGSAPIGSAPTPANTTAPPALPSTDRIRVERRGAWIEPPGGPRGPLERRRALRQILERLISQALTAPGTSLPAAALAEAGWPDEPVSPKAASDRLYTALSTLRKLGLRAALRSGEDGYSLDPARIEVVDAEDG